jgi:predicted nucleotidyltransferase
MGLNAQEKNALKQELVDCLQGEKEILKIVIFGSFVHADDPHDLDVAVFQDTAEPSLPLAMKYRQRTRAIARRIPLDILPVKCRTQDDPFLAEIAKGEVIYER